MIQRKMKRSREYMADTAVAAHSPVSFDLWMPTRPPACRSYEARVIIDSTSARSIHRYGSPDGTIE